MERKALRLGPGSSQPQPQQGTQESTVLESTCEVQNRPECPTLTQGRIWVTPGDEREGGEGRGAAEVPQGLVMFSFTAVTPSSLCGMGPTVGDLCAPLWVSCFSKKIYFEKENGNREGSGGRACRLAPGSGSKGSRNTVGGGTGALLGREPVLHGARQAGSATTDPTPPTPPVLTPAPSLHDGRPGRGQAEPPAQRKPDSRHHHSFIWRCTQPVHTGHLSSRLHL